MEAKSTGRLNKKSVYGLSNTATKNLRMTNNVSTAGTSFNSVMFKQTLKFQVTLVERVRAETSGLHD